MKDEIVARLKHHRNKENEFAASLRFAVVSRTIAEAKSEAFDQAIAIVKEVMEREQN